jgi:hypothetical protein
MSQQLTSVESNDTFAEFIKIVVQDVLAGVIPVLNDVRDIINDLTTRVSSLEERVTVEQADVSSVKSSLEKLRLQSGAVQLELQKMQYEANVRDCKRTAANVCAFPVRKPPASAGDPSDTSAVRRTLASELPGVACELKPFKSGGFKISFQATSVSRPRDSATKIISVAPTFLKRHGLAVTRDYPAPLRKARQTVQSFVAEVRRMQRFSNLKIELGNGHLKVNGKQLGPEYLWPNAISAGKSELLDLIALSEFCICKDWTKGLLYNDLVRLNLQHFTGDTNAG